MDPVASRTRAAASSCTRTGTIDLNEAGDLLPECRLGSLGSRLLTPRTRGEKRRGFRSERTKQLTLHSLLYGYQSRRTTVHRPRLSGGGTVGRFPIGRRVLFACSAFFAFALLVSSTRTALVSGLRCACVCVFVCPCACLYGRPIRCRGKNTHKKRQRRREKKSKTSTSSRSPSVGVALYRQAVAFEAPIRMCSPAGAPCSNAHSLFASSPKNIVLFRESNFVLVPVSVECQCQFHRSHGYHEQREHHRTSHTGGAFQTTLVGPTESQLP